jgi:antitoxin component of RelBE/YafQ-DinJ toxin-antitoxin module
LLPNSTQSGTSGWAELHSLGNKLTFAKITILEFGGFKTRFMEPESTPEFPVHPAYMDPSLMGNIVRGLRVNGTYGDTDKATRMLFHELANEPELPLRVAVGPDANSFIKQQLKKVEADIAKYERWSDNLQQDDISPGPVW